MSQTSKKQKPQTLTARYLIADCLHDLVYEANLLEIHKDYQDLFTALMRIEEADDPDFRERALGVYNFTKILSDKLAGLNWETLSEAINNQRDETALEIIPSNEL